jgi:hypothetical protein
VQHGKQRFDLVEWKSEFRPGSSAARLTIGLHGKSEDEILTLVLITDDAMLR